MNSFPVAVSELLLAPPPPPPALPPDSTVSEHGQTENATNPEGPGGVRTMPPAMQTLVPPHSVPNMHLPPMIPPSHLRLPPPPPPPPEAEAPHAVGGHYGMPYPHSNFPMHNRRPHHQHHQSGRPFPFRGAPAPWAQHRHVPPGLQGPWQPPSAERPSGAFEQLHPPGVPGEHFVGLDQMGEVNVEPRADITFPPGITGSDANNSKDPKLMPDATTYKDHKNEADPKDPKLPRELTELFEALNCKLCEVVSSSTVQAKHHYSGKPHEKKVRQWLQKWSEETGQPMPKRPKIDTAVTDVNPEDLFCRICEVTFTSVKHGEQHRMGKPHQKALRLGYNPSKSKAKKVEAPFDPTGRFGIGEGFQKEPPSNSTEAVQPDAEQDGSLVPLVSKNPPINSKFYCDLCKISTTSQEHLDSHYVGAKHRKAQVNAAKAGIKPEVSVVPPPVEPAVSILASVISDRGSRGKTVVSDLSIYRTPSGQFYCHPCNTTVNSEKTFKDHTESKRHKFKVATFKRS